MTSSCSSPFPGNINGISRISVLDCFLLLLHGNRTIFVQHIECIFGTTLILFVLMHS